MNRLPVEVLLCIFKLLHPAQKRECLLVCRLWHHVIESSCLWDTIIITGSNALKHSIQGDQTQQLLIETRNAVELNSLPLLFPYLHFLYIFQQDDSNTKYENIDVENFNSWQHHLQSIVGYSLLHHVLSTGTYHKLTNITLKDDPCYMEAPYTNERIFKCFQSTPALSILRLEDFEIEFDDYEFLHEYAPSLTSLTLCRGAIEDTPMPNIVMPASKMTHLQIDWVNLSGYMQARLVTFIIQKYVNLQHFSFRMQEKNLESEDYFFIECAEPLIQRLGNQLTTFGINSEISSEVFTLLDESNYHLQHAEFSTRDIIHFTERLISSNQIHSLSTLTLHWRFSSTLPSFKSLVHLKSLIFKNIPSHSYNGEPNFSVAFNRLLIEQCPDNLSTLELYNVNLIIDPTLLSVPLSLHRLKLESVDMIQDISECLSTCCPQLKEIHIGASRTQEIILDLPDLNLSLFETFNQSRTYLLTDINNEVYVYDGKNTRTHIRHYLKERYGNHNLSMYPIFKMGLSGSTENRTIINLTCRSLDTLFIDGRIALQEK
ncbi:hypothetical protein K501DRAFT_275542 [Backusella circina FSU 941]|nr:hypothetical protein K501DRAFT_275542 [Backusella circina FSU 941]